MILIGLRKNEKYIPIFIKEVLFFPWKSDYEYVLAFRYINNILLMYLV